MVVRTEKYGRREGNGSSVYRAHLPLDSGLDFLKGPLRHFVQKLGFDGSLYSRGDVNPRQITLQFFGMTAGKKDESILLDRARNEQKSIPPHGSLVAVSSWMPFGEQALLGVATGREIADREALAAYRTSYKRLDPPIKKELEELLQDPSRASELLWTMVDLVGNPEIQEIVRRNREEGAEILSKITAVPEEFQQYSPRERLAIIIRRSKRYLKKLPNLLRRPHKLPPGIFDNGASIVL